MKNRVTTDRRSFIKAAAPLLIGMRSLTRAQTLAERGRFSDEQLPLARERLLKMVNAERASAGLNQLQLDDLACQVANAHAADMVKGRFLSHWGSDGRKPYHRYGMAGGTDGLQENCSSAEGIASVSPLPVLNDLNDMHQSMMDEVPPTDAHRKTILYPYHTHVGFGIALENRSLRLDELYLARYLQIDPFVNYAAPKSTVVITGRLLAPAKFLNTVDVCFEPLPVAPEIEWLRQLRPVSLPEAYARLRPKTPPGTFYTDGGTGDFDWGDNGKIRLNFKLSKPEPGIYTLLFWVRRVPADKGFIGAQVCILSQSKRAN